MAVVCSRGQITLAGRGEDTRTIAQICAIPELNLSSSHTGLCLLATPIFLTSEIGLLATSYLGWDNQKEKWREGANMYMYIGHQAHRIGIEPKYLGGGLGG